LHGGPAHKVLRKRNRIINKVKTKYWQKTHKYGVMLPKSVNKALCIDKESGTDLCTKAIAKEMKNVEHAFEFRDGDKVPVAHQKINCHMIFDVKMDITRKATLVAGDIRQARLMTWCSPVSCPGTVSAWHSYWQP
jgi:hypothetical protein